MTGQTTMATVVQHLEFHRALHDGTEAQLQDLERYQEMATTSLTAYEDPFDRAVALAFHVVLEGEMDPWSLDLAHFARLYMARVHDVGVDLVTAGRLVAMAWGVLAVQAKELHARVSPPEEPEELGWDDLPDAWMADDRTWDVNERILDSDPIAPLVTHRAERPVSLLELVNVLEDARAEAEVRLALHEARKKERTRRDKVNERKRAAGQVHKENLEEEIRDVAAHIAGFHTDELPMAACHDGTKEGLITALVSLLFLGRAGAVRLEQDPFPTGPIVIHVLDREKLLKGVDASDLPKVGEDAAKEAEAKAKAAKRKGTGNRRNGGPDHDRVQEELDVNTEEDTDGGTTLEVSP